MNNRHHEYARRTVAGALRIIGALAALVLVVWLIVGRSTHPVQVVDEAERAVSVEDVLQRTSDFATLAPRPQGTPPDVATSMNSLLSLPGEDLDTAIKAVVLDAGLSRSDKLQILWHGYSNHPDEAVRFLDWLRLFQPIELTGELITEFQNQPDLEIKKALLAVLAAATDHVNSLTESAPAEDWEFVRGETEKIQTLYKATAQTDEAELRRQALLRLPALLPTGELGEFLELLNRDYTSGKEVVSYDELLGVWVEAALADAEAQTTLLPGLLGSLKGEAGGFEDEQVNARLYEMVKSVPLEPIAKAQLRDFLAEHEPVKASPESFYDWLEAYAAVALDDQQTETTMRNYLLNGEPRQQAGIIINQTKEYWGHFTEDQLVAVAGSLGEGQRQADPESRTAAQIQEALLSLARIDRPAVTEAANRQLETIPSP